MKKLVKFFSIILIFMVIVAGGVISYVKIALPNVGEAQTLKINYTPECIERGKYLANDVTACMVVRSANITSSKETGIGNWSEEAFISRFKSYVDSNYKPYTIEKGTFNSIMPWMMYGGMNRTDLAAIYAYLHSLPAKENSVIKFSFPGIAKQ